MGKGNKPGLLPLPPRVARAVDQDAGQRMEGRSCSRESVRLMQAMQRDVLNRARELQVTSAIVQPLGGRIRFAVAVSTDLNQRLRLLQRDTHLMGVRRIAHS